MCARCRHHATEGPASRLQRCPRCENFVLVEPAAIADADGDPFLGRVIAGRFGVLELLGAGSMGTVYRARQEAMRRDVALKIVRSDRLVDPQAIGRFRQEAHATSLLRSPHTVTVFDFGEIKATEGEDELVDGSLFLAMELLNGESLGDRLKRVGRIGTSEALRIMRHTLISLSEAHEKGIIHRDLKPDNLLLVPQPSGGGELCQVLDFGIAKLLTHEGGVDALETQAGTVFGTPRYMSPEQAQGKQLDARSDLYSLGVILYHMLLGHPPYTDGDAVVVMAHHIKTVPKRPSKVDPALELPADVEALLMRVLDKKPGNRPQSAAEFLGLLDELAPLPPESSSTRLMAIEGAGAWLKPSTRLVILSVIASGLLLAVAWTLTRPPAALRIEMRVTDGFSPPIVPLPSPPKTGVTALREEPAASATASAPAPSAVVRPAPATKQPGAKRRYQRFDRP